MRDIIEKLIKEAQSVYGGFTLSANDLTAGTVAAALLTDKGNVYTGICIDVACGMGFCAEHAAIAEMLKHRETRIEMAVAVAGDGVHPPCGRCREFMMQIDRDNRDTNVVLPGNRVALLKDLLPEQWTE